MTRVARDNEHYYQQSTPEQRQINTKEEGPWTGDFTLVNKQAKQQSFLQKTGLSLLQFKYLFPFVIYSIRS